MRRECSAVAEEDVDLAEEHEARAVEHAASVEAVAAAETILVVFVCSLKLSLASVYSLAWLRSGRGPSHSSARLVGVDH
eukprot:737943-Rhodomonas_salina.1